MILSLNNINKSYHNPEGNIARSVLSGITLKVNRGDLIAIEGPSGSGKSTLLNICGALDSPDSGEIELNGESYSGLNEKELAAFRNTKIGFVFQEHLLLPQCSVLENVLIPTIPLKTEMSERACRLLESVGLGDRLNSSVTHLSTGECQRVAVARALVNNPQLLLADEPTGSLDKENGDKLALLFKKLNHENSTTIISVTHSEAFASCMDKRYILSDGKLSEKK